MNSAKRQLEMGDEFPYEGRSPARDWAHRAARGVINNLCDRRGIKRGFEHVDDDIRIEIVDTMAEIIREAHRQYG